VQSLPLMTFPKTEKQRENNLAPTNLGLRMNDNRVGQLTFSSFNSKKLFVINKHWKIEVVNYRGSSRKIPQAKIFFVQE
jgi:hypothetical protein